jgi:EAL domain-containing protein (putative c-di-GMP-specific phosphodiesterase class I)
VSLKGASDEAYYQALVRLQEPDGKLHTAAEFIPTAEHIGVISKIDHWTTRSALSVVNQQKQQGQQLHLFVSQASDLLDNFERLSWLKEKHRRGLIAAGDLTFEFRLKDLVRHLESAKICFEMLNSLEIMTSLNGYDHSAEAQRLIKHLPLEYVKLDTRLLQDPACDLKDLIASIHALNIKVIAPQVEDPRSIALLWSSGADFVQGNFVQRPESNLLYDFHESVLN